MPAVSRSRSRVVLQQVADALGDVDLYIEQQSKESQTFATVTTDIARRLLAAGRAEDALTALEKTKFDSCREIPLNGKFCVLRVLESLGRAEEAQQFRWKSFEQNLNDELLREYVKRLPILMTLKLKKRHLHLSEPSPMQTMHSISSFNIHHLVKRLSWWSVEQVRWMAIIMS